MSEQSLARRCPIPDTWCALTIDEAAEIAPGVPVDSLPDDHLVHFVPVASVAEDFAGVDVKQLRPLQEVRKGYTACVGGDVLCSTTGAAATPPWDTCPRPRSCRTGSRDRISKKWQHEDGRLEGGKRRAPQSSTD